MLLTNVEKYSFVLNLEKLSNEHFEQILLMLVNEKYLGDNFFSKFDISNRLKALKDSVNNHLQPDDRKVIFNYLRNIYEFYNSINDVDINTPLITQMRIFESPATSLMISARNTRVIDKINTSIGERYDSRTEFLSNLAEFDLNEFIINLLDENDKKNIDLRKLVPEGAIEFIFAAMVQDESSFIDDYIIKEDKINVRDSFIEYLFYKEEYQKIINIVKQLKPQFTNDTNVLYSVAMTYYQQQDIDNCLTYLKVMYNLVPENSMTVANIAYCYLCKGELTKAEELCQKSLELNTSNKYAFKNMALIRLIERDTYGFKEYLGKIEDIGDLMDVIIKDYQYIKDQLVLSYDEYIQVLNLR